MLTPNDLLQFLEQNHIAGEILFVDTPTPTVEAAAQALNTQPERIAKSVLFILPDEVVLAITCGTLLIERRALATAFGVGRKKVKLADPETVLQKTGYPVGTVPPFGHPQPLKTVIDPRVLERAQIYAGGGEHNAMLRLENSQDILRVSEAQILNLHNLPV